MGKIKKILENDPSTGLLNEIYLVTSTEAVYDSKGKDLEYTLLNLSLLGIYKIYNTLFRGCYYYQDYNGNLLMKISRGYNAASVSNLIKLPVDQSIIIEGAAYTDRIGFEKVPAILFFNESFDLISYLFNSLSPNFELQSEAIPSDAVFFAVQFLINGGDIKYKDRTDVCDTGINIYTLQIIKNLIYNTKLSIDLSIDFIFLQLDADSIRQSFILSNLEVSSLTESAPFGMIFTSNFRIKSIIYNASKPKSDNKIIICNSLNEDAKTLNIKLVISIPDAAAGLNIVSNLYLKIEAGDVLFILGNDLYCNTANGNFDNVTYSIGNVRNLSSSNIDDTVSYAQKLAVLKIILVQGFIEVPYDLYINHIVSSEYSINYLSGKILSITGDSEAAGHTIGKQNTYGALIASRNKMTINNYAINGRKLITGEETSLVDTYTEIAENSDYILVQIGYNDAFDAEIDDNSEDTTTFKGAFNVLAKGLQSNYPKARIGFIEPYYFGGTSLKPRATWIKERCEFYHILCIDGTAMSGLRKDCSELSDYFIDSVHLTALGHERVSYIYENFLKTI